MENLRSKLIERLTNTVRGLENGDFSNEDLNRMETLVKSFDSGKDLSGESGDDQSGEDSSGGNDEFSTHELLTYVFVGWYVNSILLEHRL